jgi:hypothetical protein
MHTSILSDVRLHGATLAGEARTKYFERIMGTYDGILARAEGVTAGGQDAFVDRMLVGVPPAFEAEARAQARSTYSKYAEQVINLRQHRDDTLRMMGYVV